MRMWWLLLCVACEGANGVDGKGAGDDTEETDAATSFGADVLPILSRNCATAGCHAGPELATGLDLTAGQAYGQMVDRPSTQLSTMDRVEPNDPIESYLIRKMENSHTQAGGSGDLMPPGFGLPATDIETIKRWISEGALDN